MFTDEEVRDTFGYVTARPADFFSASWNAIWGAYTALFRGSIYNTRAEDFQTAIRPLTETLKFAAPLIVAGLGVGLAFRAALFNIGGRGQMLMAGAAAGWVGYQFDLPCADPRDAWQSWSAWPPARSGAAWSASSRPAPARTR